jgi:hypothetical protein
MAKNDKPVARTATVLRKTAETDIALTLAIDGRGVSQIDTGVPFFDHMLTLFTKHGLFDLTVKAKGDVEVDGARLTALGVDQVEFLIAPNPGEQPRPLRQVASGQLRGQRAVVGGRLHGRVGL